MLPNRLAAGFPYIKVRFIRKKAERNIKQTIKLSFWLAQNLSFSLKRELSACILRKIPD
jgi:hypothetical protein